MPTVSLNAPAPAEDPEFSAEACAPEAAGAEPQGMPAPQEQGCRRSELQGVVPLDAEWRRAGLEVGSPLRK